jgi:serine/threonine-protein kinase
VLNEEPPAFSSMQLQVPNGLETVVRKALSKACEQRFESIAELAAALAPFAEPLVWRRLRFSSVNPSQTRWATHDGKTLPSPHSSTSAVGVSSVDEPAAPKAKRRGRVRIVGTLAALLAIVLVLLLRPARHKPAPRSTATLETATQPRATAEPRAPLPTSSPLPPESAGREAHGSGADSVPTPETTSVSSAKPSESASDAAAAPGTSTHELAPVVQRRLRPQAAPRPVPSEPAKQPATSVTEALRAPAKSAIELPDFGGRR